MRFLLGLFLGIALGYMLTTQVAKQAEMNDTFVAGHHGAAV